MSYYWEQRNNAILNFKSTLNDKEEYEYILHKNGKGYKHFLKKTYLNLWEIIRPDALAYFGKDGKEKDGMWHTNDYENNPKTIPEGNMLSSQVSCVNHLFLLRKNQDYATAILKNIDSRIVEAQIIDDGYVEFEVMGGKNQNPLGEKEQVILHGKKWKRQRGAFSTSIDALMIGKKGVKDGGKNILLLIEWKYTEDGKKKFTSSSNHATYKKLLRVENCPINVHENIEELLSEPYYQPIRQTLLGWKMEKLSEYNCDKYIHLHIIPRENDIFRENLVNWKNLLKDPQKYKVLSPEELLLPLRNNQNLKDFFDYLKARYLEKNI